MISSEQIEENMARHLAMCEDLKLHGLTLDFVKSIPVDSWRQVGDKESLFYDNLFRKKLYINYNHKGQNPDGQIILLVEDIKSGIPEISVDYAYKGFPNAPIAMLYIKIKNDVELLNIFKNAFPDEYKKLKK